MIGVGWGGAIHWRGAAQGVPAGFDVPAAEVELCQSPCFVASVPRR